MRPAASPAVEDADAAGGVVVMSAFVFVPAGRLQLFRRAVSLWDGLKSEKDRGGRVG